tara:strand:- start:208014 stop:208928 length:915 start_codon:yes stop_codon:yes gene_type:complete
MNTYTIQHRFHTLAQYYSDKNDYLPSFELRSVKFSHWDFNFSEGHKTNFWLIEDQIEADDFRSAMSKFNKKNTPIFAKISLLSQCFSEQLNEPFLVRKHGCDIAFFRYTRSTRGVPLAFDSNSMKALEALQDRKDISPEFYYYWNDMQNVTGYSAKLLLSCSALEALAKSSINTQKKNEFFKEVLGEELARKIWGNKDVGIRHRLVHGEYFNEGTDKENYLKQIHEKVIEYFNKEIFKENLIRHVANPQRHPDGNKEGGFYFIKRISDSPSFDLKSLIKGCDDNFDSYLEKFELLSESEIDVQY